MAFNIAQSACDSPGGCNCLIVTGNEPIQVAMANANNNPGFVYGINWGITGPTVPNSEQSQQPGPGWIGPQNGIILSNAPNNNRAYITPFFLAPNGAQTFYGQIRVNFPAPNQATLNAVANQNSPQDITITLQAGGGGGFDDN